jgi:hypothetical protein
MSSKPTEDKPPETDKVKAEKVPEAPPAGEVAEVAVVPPATDEIPDPPKKSAPAERPKMVPGGRMR